MSIPSRHQYVSVIPSQARSRNRIRTDTSTQDTDPYPIKSIEHFRPQRVADVFAAIEQIAISESIAVSVICDVLSLSRSGFHAWQTRGLSVRDERDEELIPLIRDIFWTHRRRYGARRIAVELVSRGEPCGVARVAKLLETQGLRAIQPKSFVPRTTNSRHRLGYSPNLLRERDAPQRINEVWVGDKQAKPPTDEGE